MSTTFVLLSSVDFEAAPSINNIYPVSQATKITSWTNMVDSQGAKIPSDVVAYVIVEIDSTDNVTIDDLVGAGGITATGAEQVRTILNP
mgnify:CR=1 FL=1